MRGAIQVLESNTPRESVQADLMNIILRESDRLSNIITNFLSYARPKVGDHVESDIGEAISDTLTLLEHGPDVHSGHILARDLPPQPVFISADIAQLKQVFWNLARNALQAMPDGGTLRVKLETVPNNRVKIVFEDTGSGMSPEQVERLFEPFSTSTSGGTGLGLSIVYQIIRDHGGTINVRSQEGEGTRITIELPREARISSATSSPAAAAGSAHRLDDFINVKNGESEISS
jgi:two-component system sensor histidine kinase PilS (NtrC family)